MILLKQITILQEGIYDNGIIVMRESGGDFDSDYEFSTINNNLELDTKSYSVTYNRGSLEKIEYNDVITNYKSEKYLINDNINGGKKQI